MALMQAFNVGLDALADWATADYEWTLLTAGTFNGDADTVAAALTGGAEVTVTGYTRLAVDTPARVVNDTDNTVRYECADPSWAGLGAGESVAAVLLSRVVTTDSDSIPIGWWAISPAVPTDIADPLVFVLTGGVVAYIDQAA